MLFYLSDDVNSESKAQYEVKNDVIDIDSCEDKVLEIMERDGFVRWSQSSEELNKFIPFST